jgi:hypothetical protein
MLTRFDILFYGLFTFFYFIVRHYFLEEKKLALWLCLNFFLLGASWVSHVKLGWLTPYYLSYMSIILI